MRFGAQVSEYRSLEDAGGGDGGDVILSVSPSFKTFVLEQLARCVRDVRARSMFGGVGIYGGDLFFALIDDDVVYFKVDDSNRADFEAAGMGPFRPFGDDGEVMQYYRLPDEVLEDVEALRPWAEKALGVARQARRSRK